jgi:hypothetical protein
MTAAVKLSAPRHPHLDVRIPKSQPSTSARSIDPVRGPLLAASRLRGDEPGEDDSATVLEPFDDGIVGHPRQMSQALVESGSSKLARK